MNIDLTIILSVYKRPWALETQYDSILSQSVKPKEIIISQNESDNFKIPKHISDNCKVFSSNYNWGVWSRFSAAMNAKTGYIMILDDDTIPGHRWIENCQSTFNSRSDAGVLGTVGIVNQDLNYLNYERVGWPEPNNLIEEVDFAGHAWCFPRELLIEFWKSASIGRHDLSGEDVNLSFAAQQLGLKTYVPPHPKDDMSLWGSQPDTAMQLGVDNNAISVNYHGSHFGQNLKDYKEKGFKYINKL